MAKFTGLPRSHKTRPGIGQRDDQKPAPAPNHPPPTPLGNEKIGPPLVAKQQQSATYLGIPPGSVRAHHVSPMRVDPRSPSPQALLHHERRSSVATPKISVTSVVQQMLPRHAGELLLRAAPMPLPHGIRPLTASSCVTEITPLGRGRLWLP